MIVILKNDKIEIISEVEGEEVNGEEVERHEVKIKADDIIFRDKRQ